MRLKLGIKGENNKIPFNYQHLLTGCLHKWIGENNLVHGKTSLYSFSWLQKVKTEKEGLILTENSTCFFSFFDEQLAKKVINGIINNPELFNGCFVNSVTIQPTPKFSNKESFFVASPVLIKRPIISKEKEKHYTYLDEESDILITDTLKTKLKLAGLNDENVYVTFNKNYSGAKTKVVAYNKIKNKTNVCPITIEGTPEQIAFAWDVGIGNSTGIGFGSLK